jgi:hypothetical protein
MFPCFLLIFAKFAKPKRFHGRAARQRSAKPFTAVRIRLEPQKLDFNEVKLFFVKHYLFYLLSN